MSGLLAFALAAELGSLLQARRWHVTAAESCTGGLVAGAITSTPGSSAWFDVAFVTYSNEGKLRWLDVPATLLATEGAVSEAVAAAMAMGALERAAADLSVAITGIAGPDGGSALKPVGTVCFAWATRQGVRVTTTRHLDGDRAGIRDASVIVALEGLIEQARMAERR
ncbi:MAG TPA: CinA family protein [Casimicrobiaceae bacterium]|nr:CinA family protein [Casimicrobiaceae bacterium]